MYGDILKLVILGENWAGKISVLQKYFKKRFNEGEKSTINPSFYEKTVNYQGKKVQLKFYDKAGQEQFNAISTMYYQNAVGTLLIYDASIFEIFDKVKCWISTLHEAVGKDITIVIIGNNFGLIDKKTMDHQKASLNPFVPEKNDNIFMFVQGQDII